MSGLPFSKILDETNSVPDVEYRPSDSGNRIERVTFPGMFFLSFPLISASTFGFLCSAETPADHHPSSGTSSNVFSVTFCSVSSSDRGVSVFENPTDNVLRIIIS